MKYEQHANPLWLPGQFVYYSFTFFYYNFTNIVADSAIMLQ